MAAQIEAGTIEITVHDIGGVDLGIKQYARTQNLSADAARQAIVAAIRTNSTGVTEANPDAAIIVDALVGFIEKPGSYADAETYAARRCAGDAADPAS